MALSPPPLLLIALLLLAPLSLPDAHALPIVDPGLFVIMGVKTCRAGSGYCILGNNCTLDEDFLPDDRGGHCHGLRSAFTPSAEFICCRYSAEPLTTESPSTDATLVADIAHKTAATSGTETAHLSQTTVPVISETKIVEPIETKNADGIESEASEPSDIKFSASVTSTKSPITPSAHLATSTSNPSITSSKLANPASSSSSPPNIPFTSSPTASSDSIPGAPSSTLPNTIPVKTDEFAKTTVISQNEEGEQSTTQADQTTYNWNTEQITTEYGEIQDAEGTTPKITMDNVQESTVLLTDSDGQNQKSKDSADNNQIGSNLVKRTRIELGEEDTNGNDQFKVTVSEITAIVQTETPLEQSNTEPHIQESVSAQEQSSNVEAYSDTTNNFTSTTEQNKDSVYSLANNGLMMHDILKLITEGEWQISFRNNEVYDTEEPDEVTDENQTEETNLLQTSVSSEGNKQENNVFNDDVDITTEYFAENRDISTDAVSHTTIANDVQNTYNNETEVTTNTHESSQVTEKILPQNETTTTVVKEIIVSNEKIGKPHTTTINPAQEENLTGNDTLSMSQKNNSSQDENESQKTGLCVGETKDDSGCWVVRFIDKRFDSFICHGSLIDSGLVVTSAVCAVSLYQAGTGNVRVQGSMPLSQPMAVRSIAVHENFRPRELVFTRDDMGLVKVDAEQRAALGCSVCFVALEQNLNSSKCYTFVDASEGDGNVTRQECMEIKKVEQDDGKYSLTCTVPNGNKKIHSGAPLVCEGSLAGVAYTSHKRIAFTPASQIVPWVRWNLQKFTT